jgi:hypothetical protein
VVFKKQSHKKVRELHGGSRSRFCTTLAFHPHPVSWPLCPHAPQLGNSLKTRHGSL